MLVITILFAILGWSGIRHEQRTPVLVFLSFSVVEPAYIIWKIVVVLMHPAGETVYLGAALTIAVLAIITRCLLVRWTVWALSGFGVGLRDVFEKEKQWDTVPFLTA